MTRFLIFNCMYLFLELTLLFLEAYEVQSWLGFSFLLIYRKIPKISPGAYIFQRPFLRGLFLEGPIFGGAYVRREICVSKSIGLACNGREIYHFCFVLLCIGGQIPSTSPRGAYIQRGDLTEGFLCYNFGGLIFGGACTWRGLFSEFYGILIITCIYNIIIFIVFRTSVRHNQAFLWKLCYIIIIIIIISIIIVIIIFYT